MRKAPSLESICFHKIILCSPESIPLSQFSPFIIQQIIQIINNPEHLRIIQKKNSHLEFLSSICEPKWKQLIYDHFWQSKSEPLILPKSIPSWEAYYYQLLYKRKQLLNKTLYVPKTRTKKMLISDNVNFHSRKINNKRKQNPIYQNKNLTPFQKKFYLKNFGR